MTWARTWAVGDLLGLVIGPLTLGLIAAGTLRLVRDVIVTLWGSVW